MSLSRIRRHALAPSRFPYIWAPFYLRLLNIFYSYAIFFSLWSSCCCSPIFFSHFVHSSCLLHITSSLEMRILCRRSPKITMMTVRESHPCWITIITIAKKRELNNTESNSNRATFVMGFQLDENFSNKKLRTVGIFFLHSWAICHSPFLQFIFDTSFFRLLFALCSCEFTICSRLFFTRICHLLISSPERIAFYFDKSRLVVGTCSNGEPLMVPSRMSKFMID